MSLSRLVVPLGTLALGAVLAVSATAGNQTGSSQDVNGQWSNPGKVLPCDFSPGTHTFTGTVQRSSCDPNKERDCRLVLVVASAKEDTARGFLAHETKGRCRVELTDGRKRVIGPLWRSSRKGQRLVRVTGVYLDGELHVSRYRILGGTAGY